jgi:hypothetical protein
MRVRNTEKGTEMAKKSDPKTTFSVRLQSQTLRALEHRACEQRTTVGAVIRMLVFDYLDQRDTEDVLAQMEARIIATINRVGRQRARARREADLTLATVDYIRRLMEARVPKRLEASEDVATVIRRGDKAFSDWVQKSLNHRISALLTVATEQSASLDDELDNAGPQTLTEPEAGVAL